MKYVTDDGNHYVTSADGSLTSTGGDGLEINKEAHAKVTVTIPTSVKADVEKAKAVYIQYFPRHNALGQLFLASPKFGASFPAIICEYT